MHAVGWTPPMRGDVPTAEQWERLVAQSSAQQTQIAVLHEREDLVIAAARGALDAEVVDEGRVFDSIQKGLKKLRKELVEKRKSVKRYRNGEVRQKLEIVAEQLGTLRGAVKKCLLRVHPDKVGSTSVAEMAETVSKLLTPLLDGSVYPMPPPKL